MNIESQVSKIVEEHSNPEEAAVLVADALDEAISNMGGAQGTNASLQIEIALEEVMELAVEDDRPELEGVAPLLALKDVDIPTAQHLLQNGYHTVEDIAESSDSEISEVEGIATDREARSVRSNAISMLEHWSEMGKEYFEEIDDEASDDSQQISKPNGYGGAKAVSESILTGDPDLITEFEQEIDSSDGGSELFGVRIWQFSGAGGDASSVEMMVDIYDDEGEFISFNVRSYSQAVDKVIEAISDFGYDKRYGMIIGEELWDRRNRGVLAQSA